MGVKDTFSSFDEGVGGFFDKFALDSHQRIQRFGRSAGVFAVTGAMLVGMGVWSFREHGVFDPSSTGQYVTSFTTSRTENQGKVSGVYRSADGKRALVMMELADPNQMSNRAEDYYAHVVGMSGGPGSDAKGVGTTMVGSILTFGNTGSIGVVLDAPDGFDQRVLNITMRAKKEFVDATKGDDSGSTEKNDKGSTYDQFDQWAVPVNPAADDVTVLDGLNGSEVPDASTLYALTAMRPDEQKLRHDLDASLAKMQTLQDRIRTYEEQTTTTSVRAGNDNDVRIVLPVLPPSLVGDEITGMSGAELSRELEKTPADEIPGLKDKSQAALDIDTVDGWIPNTYELHAGTVVLGGVDFDWRSRTLAEGYFDQLIGPNGDRSQFFEDLLVSRNEARKSDVTKDLRSMEWPLTNGSRLDASTFRDNELAPLIQLRENLLDAYSEYLSEKENYESKLLTNLLTMQLNLDNMDGSSSFITGKDAVTFRS